MVPDLDSLHVESTVPETENTYAGHRRNVAPAGKPAARTSLVFILLHQLTKVLLLSVIETSAMVPSSTFQKDPPDNSVALFRDTTICDASLMKMVPLALNKEPYVMR